MKRESMSNEDMKRESMSNEDMKRESMSNEDMKRESMSNEDMKRSGFWFPISLENENESFNTNSFLVNSHNMGTMNLAK